MDTAHDDGHLTDARALLAKALTMEVLSPRGVPTEPGFTAEDEAEFEQLRAKLEACSTADSLARLCSAFLTVGAYLHGALTGAKHRVLIAMPAAKATL